MWTWSSRDTLWCGLIFPWLACTSSCTWWSHGYHIGLRSLPRSHRYSHPPQRSSGRGENLQMACDFRQLRSSFLIQIYSKREKIESVCEELKEAKTQKEFLNIQRPKKKILKPKRLQAVKNKNESQENERSQGPQEVQAPSPTTNLHRKVLAASESVELIPDNDRLSQYGLEDGWFTQTKSVDLDRILFQAVRSWHLVPLSKGFVRFGSEEVKTG